MLRRHDGETELDKPAQLREPEPAPAAVPGSLAWASSVGNHAIARYAKQQALSRQADEAAPSTIDESEEAVEEGFPDEEIVSEMPAGGPPAAEGPAEEAPLPDDALPA